MYAHTFKMMQYLPKGGYLIGEYEVVISFLWFFQTDVYVEIWHVMLTEL